MIKILRIILFAMLIHLVKVVWGRGLGKIKVFYKVYILLYKKLRPTYEYTVIEDSKMCTSGLKEQYLRTLQYYTVYGGWEKYTTQIFKEVVKNGDVVIDAGANMGYYTLLASRLVGAEGKVYSFEPEDNNYDMLCRNIKLNGYANIITEKKAVGDKTCTLSLYLDDEDIGSHSLYGDRRQRSVKVDVIRLDEYFKNRNIINIVKLDIEGAEYLAMKGMQNIIKRNNDIKIFIEINLPCLIRSGVNPVEIISELLDDYSVLMINDWGRGDNYIKIESVDEVIKMANRKDPVNLYLKRLNGKA